MRSTRVALLATAAVLVAGASVGYGASRNDTTRVGASAYKLKEMAVIGPRTVASGRVTLTAKNLGTVEHELVVFKGAGPLTVKNFKAVEAGRALGEIPETAPGKTGSVTLTLKSGKYLLACNIVGHYQLGMTSTLSVK